MAMTKEEFKKRWESSENGDGITFKDFAECAIAWNISSTPQIRPMLKIANQVLVAAGCEKYFEEEDDD